MHKKLQRLNSRFERFRRVRLPGRVKRVKKASRHPYAVPVFTIGVLLIISLIGILLWSGNSTPKSSAYVVIVSRDGAQQVVPSREPTVGTLLAKLHIKLYQGDVVEPG